MLLALTNSNEEKSANVQASKDERPHKLAIGMVSANEEHYHQHHSLVTLEIEQDTKVFSLKTLNKLPYFEAMFSERWFSNRSRLNNATIKIFDDNNVMFRLNDLELFLKCVELKHIPNDTMLNLQEMESLVNCSDFLCGGDAKIDAKIDENKLIQYFQARIPPITSLQRKQWLIESNNVLIRKALMEYDQLLQQQISVVRSKALLNNSESEKQILTSIEYDSDTAADLFRRKFSFQVTFDKDNNQIGIKINGFDEDLWHHLYNAFDINNYWHYFGKQIEYLVKELLQWNERKRDNPNLKIVCDRDEKEAIVLLLETIVDKFIEEKDGETMNAKPHFENPNIPPTVSVCSLLIAHINLVHGGKIGCFRIISRGFGPYLPYLNESECNKLVLVILQSYPHYLTAGKNVRGRSIPSISASIASWFEFFEQLLKRCDAAFLVSNASIWFPIGHDISEFKAASIARHAKNDRQTKNSDSKYDPNWIKKHGAKWDNFIFNEIIPKFGTQNAFNFGLYFIDYVMFRSSTGSIDSSDFDQRYFDFLKENVGITWNLLQTK